MLVSQFTLTCEPENVDRVRQRLNQIIQLCRFLVEEDPYKAHKKYIDMKYKTDAVFRAKGERPDHATT